MLTFKKKKSAPLYAFLAIGDYDNVSLTLLTNTRRKIKITCHVYTYNFWQT